MTDYTTYVNVKQGTFSESKFSCGNTLPLVAAPFGMNHFCLQTRRDGGGWFYHPTHHQTEGIRLTHQPSPWVGDYGQLILMPQSGEAYVTEWQRACSYRELAMEPGSMEIGFTRYGAVMALAASDRCAVMEIQWDTDKTPRLAVLPFDVPAQMMLDPDAGVLTLWVDACNQGSSAKLRLYIHMEFDRPVDGEKTIITGSDNEKKQGLSGSGMGTGINIAFRVEKGERLTVRMGTSFISAELARENLRREIGEKSYRALRSETRDKWNTLLGKIRITGTEEKLRTFYSCLHRCFLFPRMFYEYDENDRPVHFSTGEGTIRPGYMYTDNGFWDTCRTLYPLLTLLIPETVKQMLEGYLNYYREEGWLPKWLSPGERGIMPGTLIDAVLADAAVKRLLTKEQMEIALEGMLKHANIPSDNRVSGRVGVSDYVKVGYIPADKYGESVNNTLDACYCDWCIAQVAGVLGKLDIQRKYEARSGSYALLFDEQEGFIRGLNSDGTRKSGFTPFEWAEEYCEGSAWQNAFGVYHDIEGLAALYGGKKQLIAKLDELFAAPPEFEVGKYWAEIHEMSEMRALGEKGFGQCGLSNQPSFHIPYLYALLGEPEKTAYWVGRLVNEAFDSSEKGYPGDEDNGSMAAWYVLSVLGFYPVCPGRAEYVRGICCAGEVRMTLGNGNVVTITENERGLCIDGEIVEEAVLSHDRLMGA